MRTKQIPYNGSVTFWSAFGTEHAKISAALAAEGISEYCPRPRTDTSALKIAMEQFGQSQCPVGQDWEVAPLQQPGTNGYELVYVQRGTTHNQRQHVVSAAVSNGIVTITSGDQTGWGLIQRHYHAVKAMVTPDAVGKCLVQIATQKLDGLCLRPNGGLYWVPDVHCDMWERYAGVVEKATGSVVTTAAWEANASTIGRIRESLLADVEQSCRDIIQDLSDGQSHDDEYFERRSRMMNRLLQRVETVEGALQESLDDCRRRLELVQSVFTAATMASL